MVDIPAEHIADAHKLSADGLVTLWELTPSGGTGVIRFKEDNPVTWRGNEYTGLPMGLSGDKESAEGGSSQPRLTIGDENVDLSAFKPLVHDGALDGALVVRIEILLDNLVNNRNIKETRHYQVRRPESYGRSRIVLQLGPYSDFLSFTLPVRTYLPPAFPAVAI